ncbi:phage tail protein [Enterobacter sp. R4-368]|uniref:phage tail protein n=1 Tax=Enterobacter sp. R4-368 TaxID=1166130 RepID=UPI00034EE822|nr:phage tail protein [Enterobacter sp. R4-368]AGN85819.1 hypothetical protein H650_11810 [Enterobacter sp. R4-368]
MTAKFFAILTNQGAALLANATALGTKLNITQMAVGDGNGTLPTPDATQTKLVNQKRIAPLNMLSVDASNTSQIIAEQVIPENEGGFWIREIGLYDDNGVLIAVANCPETYKPQLQEGSGRTQTIRMVLIVSSTAAVTLKIDPSVVLATRQYADDKAIEVKNYTDNLMKQHVADTNPHKQYAPVASPVFTGTPKAPTAAQASNDTQLANTAFVQAAIAALVSGELAKKQPLDKTLTDLSGKSAAAILEYLGLGNLKYGAPMIGELVHWPRSEMPQEIWTDCGMEFIPYMGQSFDAVKYPLLAQLHPTNKLPADMRGYVPRGWDNARGIDIARVLMSSQEDAIRNIVGTWSPITGGYYENGFGGAVTKNTGSQYPQIATSTGTITNGLKFDASLYVPTASENRVRNVAWNMIVRAK